MATNRQRASDVRTTFGYKVDTASAQRVINTNRTVTQAVTAELDRTRKAAVSVEDVATQLNRQFASMAREKGIDQLTSDAIRAGKQTKDWAASLRTVSEELSAIGASESEIRRVAQAIGDAQGGSGLRGRASSTLGRIGQEIRYLPAIGLGGNLSTDAVGKVLYTADAALGALGATAAQVAAASLIAAPAVIGVALAIGEYTKQIDAQKRGLDAALSAQDKYLTALQNLSTAQARAALQDEIRRNHILVSEANSVQSTIWEQWDALVRQYGEVGARALTAIGSPFAALQDRLTELNGQIEESDGYILRLRAGIEGGAFAANDAAEAERLLAAERSRLANLTVNAVIAADRMTAEQRRSRIAEIDREIMLLQAFGDTSAETQQSIADLRAEADGLKAVFNSTADIAARQSAAGQLLEDSADQQLKAAEAYGKAREKLFEAQEAVKEYAAKAEQELSDLYAEYVADRQDIIADGNERAAEIIADGEEARLKIYSDFSKAYGEAVAERDALAAHKARVAAVDELDKQDKAQRKQLDQLDKAEKKKLDALEAKYRDQYAKLSQSIARETELRAAALRRAEVDAQNAAFLISATQAQYASAAIKAYEVGYITAQNYIAGLVAGGKYSPGVTIVPGSGKMSLPPVTGTAAGMSSSALDSAIDERLLAYMRRARYGGVEV